MSNALTDIAITPTQPWCRESVPALGLFQRPVKPGLPYLADFGQTPTSGPRHIIGSSFCSAS